MNRRKIIFVCGLALAASSGPVQVLAASSITYTYDVFGQLTAVSSTAGRSVTYTYDVAGNRTNMAATGTTASNAAPPNVMTEQAAASADRATLGGRSFGAYAEVSEMDQSLARPIADLRIRTLH